jgi:hypothetical protein
MQAQNAGQARLWDLEFNSCRWPIGQPWERAEFFCGEPAVAGCSWCREHRSRAFTRPLLRQTKEQQALQGA